ncbi:MAG: NADPH-dependent glutamate synthase [bacterium]
MAEKKKQVTMPEQTPEQRKKNFNEVPLGLTAELAVQEAVRCIQCKNPLCRKGCPVNIDIKAFIKLITENKFVEAAQKIKEQNALPAVCGRVCPQEDQCEKACILSKKGNPIAIGYLERFAADFEREQGKFKIPEIHTSSSKKVAIIGAGPSGLTCAGELKLMGHEVHVFEALHTAGGVLSYGIPEFRLPKHIVASEVEYLSRLGVAISCSKVMGKLKNIDQLLTEGFHAVYIATGAGYPSFMNIPGENLNYVYSANEFLTRINLMKAYKFPEYDTPVEIGDNAAVIGGGNTAMDAARTALRLGPKKVYLIYRRSFEEMPARIEEIHHAQDEGIEFLILAAPVKYIGDEHLNVKKAVCIKMELGEADASGRRRPAPIPGSEFELDVSSVVVAVGTKANPIIPESTPDLKLNKWGYIEADQTGQTSKKAVFAGGDIVSGAATVIEAMGAGKIAAKSIDMYLQRL